jgi:hypothetical protein
MDEYNLEPILEYNMTEEEAIAYKIGLLWLNHSRRLFPNYKHNSNYPKKGDPRKSHLFKICWKLQKETKGIVKYEEYNFYIIAQLQLLKNFTSELHPLITPQCLVGDNAWIRWKIWKKKFEKVNKSGDGLKQCSSDEIKSELNKAKRLLDSKFGELTEEKVIVLKKELERNIKLGIISGFYAVLSPLISKHCDLSKLTYYKNNINDEIIEYFKNLDNPTK